MKYRLVGSSLVISWMLESFLYVERKVSELDQIISGDCNITILNIPSINFLMFCSEMIFIS